MFGKINETIEYLDKSNILTRAEFYKLTLTRIGKYIAFTILLLVGAIGIGLSLNRPIGYQEVGLALDASGAVILAYAAVDEYVDRVHRASFAPTAHQIDHSESTIADLKTTVDQLSGLSLLLTGFTLQFWVAVLT